MKRYKISGQISETQVVLAGDCVMIQPVSFSVWFYVDADSARQAVERAEFLCPDLDIRSVEVE